MSHNNFRPSLSFSSNRDQCVSETFFSSLYLLLRLKESHEVTRMWMDQRPKQSLPKPNKESMEKDSTTFLFIYGFSLFFLNKKMQMPPDFKSQARDAWTKPKTRHYWLIDRQKFSTSVSTFIGFCSISMILSTFELIVFSYLVSLISYRPFDNWWSFFSSMKLINYKGTSRILK